MLIFPSYQTNYIFGGMHRLMERWSVSHRWYAPAWTCQSDLINLIPVLQYLSIGNGLCLPYPFCTGIFTYFSRFEPVTQSVISRVASLVFSKQYVLNLLKLCLKMFEINDCYYLDNNFYLRNFVRERKLGKIKSRLTSVSR